MRLIDILAMLLTLSALFSWFNQRYLKFPTTIGLMLIALLVSFVLLALEPIAPALEEQARAFLVRIRFDDTLLHGMLALLLFAGALHVNLEDLRKHRWMIGILATASVIGATLLVGLGAWGLFALVGLDIPLIYCLIFGALIAPTDSIAVLGIMKSSAAPKSVDAMVTGESLLNDGVAVGTFLLFMGIATNGRMMGAQEVISLLAKEILGGVALGMTTGWLAYQMLRRLDDYKSAVLITLALATGVYALAEHLGLSAPIAVVVAGSMVANYGRHLAMSDKSRAQLDTFWVLVDEVLNAVLFGNPP
jgi:CPA1 family monovalent cation:H+ antiporter